MNNELIEKLSKLKLEEKHYLRILNMSFYDDKKKHEIFINLINVKREIKKIKFKLRVNREMNKNEQYR